MFGVGGGGWWAALGGWAGGVRGGRCVGCPPVLLGAVFLSFRCVRLFANFEPGLGQCLVGWEGGVCPFLVSWLCLLAPAARAALLFPLRFRLPSSAFSLLSASQVAILPGPWA